MQITIIQTGSVPQPIQHRFQPYPAMFEAMFERLGEGFSCRTVPVFEGAPFPEIAGLEAVVITGSAAGVYDDYVWMDPLRQFIRAAYAQELPMLGICFGHQVMADALGGDVRKSEKGWGLGRHVYAVTRRPAFMAGLGDTLAVACSHQDQVIVPPAEAEVILSSEFTPNAGLFYRSGKALSFQPHPEFEDDYARALAELRRGKASDAVVDAAIASLARASDSLEVARAIGRFFKAARAA